MLTSPGAAQEQQGLYLLWLQGRVDGSPAPEHCQCHRAVTPRAVPGVAPCPLASLPCQLCSPAFPREVKPSCISEVSQGC